MTPNQIAALTCIFATTMLAAGCSDKPSEAATPSAQLQVAASPSVEAGRYLVKLGGCNDCHTPGFAETNGQAPAEADWLTGSPVGYSGPWGTTYPSNLRLFAQTLDEDDFVALGHGEPGRPPMPWASLKAMSENDLRSIYRYVRYLGPKGEQAPAPLNPGIVAKGPTLVMVPVINN